MRTLLLLLLLPLFASAGFGQMSTFDFDNEGWMADGDVASPFPDWRPTNGNPGGHIRVTDLSTGGTWYYVAPAKFLGIKCDAYGNFLRYDQFVSNNSNPNNSPDVEIKGAGMTMVFNNPVTPGTTWTHYDILLREDAGWRLNNLTGPTPTHEQFRAILADVTSLRIRGEYYSQAADYGGLDNVKLESEFHFEFDLDGDDSSGGINGDYQAPPSCIPTGGIIDLDAKLNTEARIDSIHVYIQGATVDDELLLGPQSGNISVVRYGAGDLTLVNNGGATTDEFLALLQLIQYIDNSLEPVSGVRVVHIQVYTDCGVVGETHEAFISIFTKPTAGLDGDTLLCYNSPAIDLRTVLNGEPDINGRWEPLLHSGTNIFDPNVDTAGTYAYIIPKAEPCEGDTSHATIRIEYPFQLRPDTTMCYDDTLFIQRPLTLTQWQWSDGSHRSKLPVTEPGTYLLVGSTEYCTFSDSVTVDFYSCDVCRPYPPNVFSPNDDGENDKWHIFLYCRWTEYRVEVYDRWGSMVFAADDPEAEWDGRVRGKDANPGVYVWRMFWTGELFGLPKTWYYEGDVTIVK